MQDISNELGAQHAEMMHVCRCHKELARAYVPMQGFGELFQPEAGLRNGTIFTDLFSPYISRRGQGDHN